MKKSFINSSFNKLNVEVKKMEYVYAALLLNSAGKEIKEDAVKKVIEATGEKADEAKVKALVASLEGVNIEEATKSAVAVAAPAATAPAATEKKEEKPAEEEKKTEEEAAGGLADLFG